MQVSHTDTADALNILATVHRHRDRPEAATEHHTQALDFAILDEHMEGEAVALRGLAECHLDQGRSDAGLE
ncbi:MAG: tetratricopeptide repeat protein [Streptosporangiaceae bacterium]